MAEIAKAARRYGLGGPPWQVREEKPEDIIDADGWLIATAWHSPERARAIAEIPAMLEYLRTAALYAPKAAAILARIDGDGQ